MPKGERPRERLRDLGPGALSTSELIAILLRTGMEGQNVLSLASGLLSRHGGLGGLARASYGELAGVKGMGDAKACQLLAGFELGRRLVSLHPEDRAVIRSPQDVFNLLGPEMAALDQEHLRVLSLNTKNQVRGVHPVYVGNVNTSIVRVSELLRPAVRENCPSIIVVHNHPSGDPAPSAEDVLITRKVRGGAELLDIEVLDHVVIGGNGFVSMKEKGLGFAGGG
jgi:DNA repair protein RadC